jgi:CRP/FNR family transcriptional regulator, cyclic AMP receptor protein
MWQIIESGSNMLTTISPEQFSRIPLFADLTKTESEELMTRFEELAFAAGDVVIRTGEFEPALYVVLSGAVSIVLDVPGGEDTFVATVEPQGVFGETSFFHPAPHSATVRCREQTTLLRLQRQEFERLLAANSLPAYRLGAKAAQILAARLQATDHWLAQLLTEEQGAAIASWRRFRERIGGSFDIPHGFIHA